MANQPQNPQQNPEQRQPAKQAPGPGQAGKNSSQPRPQNPADLGHDPEPDNIQAQRKDIGQSSEKH